MELLLSEISSRASEASWAVSREEPLERVTELQSDTLLRALDGASSKDQFELPERRVALLVRDSVRLLITAFDQEPNLLVSCRKALWWAGLVRGSLKPISRADLHLFIVATPSTGQEENILRDRSRIEADERICRKHVWVPAIDSDVTEFLDATFLARPWQRDTLAPQSLDPLQRLVETVGLAAEIATQWINALSSLDDAKTDAIAEMLSSFYESSNGD